jgi:2,5-diamino-6-(ribosylamino)-4(3H)-pyrimidinone 5'-phosphate reductase
LKPRAKRPSGGLKPPIGNQRSLDVKKGDVSFVIVDNKPHLNAHGSEYFAKRSKVFYLVTTNKSHPAYTLKEKYPNIKILHYENEIDFVDVFKRFKEDYGIERVTIQTGGTLNAHLLRLGLIDRILIVIAPCMIGGNSTQSLIGGESLHTEEDLKKIKPLKLTKCEALKDSYIRLEYDVINETIIEEL